MDYLYGLPSSATAAAELAAIAAAHAKRPTAVQPLRLDIGVERGGLVEARHRVHGAVVAAPDVLVASARDPRHVSWWRSCAKPFQVLPFVRESGLDLCRWGDDVLALACASHGGEPEHVTLAAKMLTDLRLPVDALACGAHVPLSDRGAEELRRSGEAPTRLHNNCSGKHAAMLARAVHHGWPTAGYHRAEHPVQDAAWREVAKWAGLPVDAVGRAVDGCGVTVFSLPLDAMARAYARLAAAANDGDVAARRVLDAMVAHPHLVGGTDRFDTALMTAGRGNIVAKVGAEGVHAVCVRDRALGFAIKVEDGATRAQFAATIAALQQLDVLPAELPPALATFARPVVHNTRGEIVGRMAPLHELSDAVATAPSTPTAASA